MTQFCSRPCFTAVALLNRVRLSDATVFCVLRVVPGEGPMSTPDADTGAPKEMPSSQDMRDSAAWRGSYTLHWDFCKVAFNLQNKS